LIKFFIMKMSKCASLFRLHFLKIHIAILFQTRANIQPASMVLSSQVVARKDSTENAVVELNFKTSSVCSLILCCNDVTEPLYMLYVDNRCKVSKMCLLGLQQKVIMPPTDYSLLNTTIATSML